MGGERFPAGSVTASVTGVGLPLLLTSSVGQLDRGDVLAGRFQIEALLGTGGSGRVLRAFDRESRTPVALKILRQELAGEPVWAERFARELRVGRAISHPNVCRVFDIGEADGHRFLSMELATGGSLRADVPKIDAWQASRRQGAGREWSDRVSDARAIVAGVAGLHQAGIVHRDLKPENILRMADGRLVVTDFGLATDPGSGPGTTIMVGTPSYMAPEVVMGDPATMRSDVWGLGMVLHEVFFGIRPQWRVLGRGYRRFVRPEAARATVERAVADLCGRCADDDPQQRPATAAEVVRELERALAGKRVVARYVRLRMVWGATAMAALVALVVVKTHYTNRAEASSSLVASGLEGQVLQPTGTALDWSRGSKTLASFAGRLQCFDPIGGGPKVRVIWDQPPRAEDVNLETGERTPSPILPETYRDGCPVLSPDGKSLLFEQTSDTGTHVFLSRSPRGTDAKQLVRGGAPAWLPNGQEFVLTADPSHVAMFSIPTGEMTLAPEPTAVVGRRMFSGQAVNADGTRLAVRYTTAGLDSLIVIHSLPGLEILGQIRAPLSNGSLRFVADQVEYVHEGAGGPLEIASLDWKSQATTNLARSTAGDLKGIVAQSPDRVAFFTSRLRSDLWLNSAGKMLQLSHDGESLNGSASSTGDLIFQRRLADGRRAIFLRRPGQPEEQVTSGPFDLTPTFLPGGQRWLYAAFDRAAVFRCELSGGACVPIHTDSLVPGFPSVDPSGQTVAYVTLMNTTRLRLFSMNQPAEYRDLGPIGAACAPFWTTPERLWAAQTFSESGATWAEIDVKAGKRTGRESTSAPDPHEECRVPPDVLSLRRAPEEGRVVTLSEYSSALAVRPSVFP